MNAHELAHWRNGACLQVSDIKVSLSSEILPEFGMMTRAINTVKNDYVRADLDALGYRALKSDVGPQKA